MNYPRETNSDESLVALCQAGQVPAFDELYRRHFHRTFRVCRALLQGAEEAQDAVQVVFMRAFMSIHKYTPTRSRFSTWLYAIAVGVAANIRRTWRRQDRLKKAYDPHARLFGSGPGNPERVAIARRSLERIHATLESMPSKKRTAFVLYHGAGLKLSEVAESMGASVPTTSARIKAAQREIMKRELSREGNQP